MREGTIKIFVVVFLACGAAATLATPVIDAAKESSPVLYYGATPRGPELESKVGRGILDPPSRLHATRSDHSALPPDGAP